MAALSSSSKNSPSFAAGAEDALAVIFSLAGPKLTDAEKAFFEKSNPLGFILFARNCETPEQVMALTRALKDCVGRECAVLIDQEGGRVQRLRPPVWRGYPAAQTFGARAEIDMMLALDDLRFNTLQMGAELRDLGINVDCTPVLDVLAPETHDVIGDRAFSEKPEIVARLGLSVCRNMLASGITPVIKHIPGHGRAAADSHLELPRVTASRADLEKTDFAPFRALAASDIAPALWAMTAHVVYTDIDADHPASVSAKATAEIIRGHMGFDGFLLSDDIDMKALKAYGDVAARALAPLKAGSDCALYCAGKLADMQKIAESVPKLGLEALQRLQKAAEYIRLAA